MALSFRHNEFRGRVFVVIRTVPVDDHAVDSAADHVRDLIVNLAGVGGTVPDVHVVRSSEPHHQVGINFGGRARIKQRVYVDFADTCGASVAIGLRDKTGRRTRIIRRLGG